MVTAKVYYSYFDPKKQKWMTKRLNPHTDIVYHPTGAAKRDNNQEPGLPVVILNLGDTKHLHFQLRSYYNDNPIPGQEFTVRQPDGHLFVLDAEDEVPRLRGRTSDVKYMSYWAHDSYLESKEGISMSLQFRFGNKSGAVNKKTNRLKKPCQAASTNARFDTTANRKWMKTKAVKKARDGVYKVLRNKFVIRKK